MEVIAEKAVENHPFSTKDSPCSSRLFFRDSQVHSVLVVTSDLRGSLKWEKKASLPKKMISCEVKENSKTTDIMTMDQGWHVSFRLHSARSVAEPSLKFDVRLIGTPSVLSTH